MNTKVAYDLLRICLQKIVTTGISSIALGRCGVGVRGRIIFWENMFANEIQNENTIANKYKILNIANSWTYCIIVLTHCDAIWRNLFLVSPDENKYLFLGLNKYYKSCQALSFIQLNFYLIRRSFPFSIRRLNSLIRLLPLKSPPSKFWFPAVSSSLSNY